jgi:hypothetical protein
MENSEEFQPASLSYEAEEHFTHPKRHQKYVSGENNGKWSELEHARYIAYLEFHRDKMRSKERRRYVPPHAEPTSSTRRCPASSPPATPSSAAATTKS